MTNLNANILAAAAALNVLAKDARENIEPGTYATSGQFIVSIDGTMNISADETYKATTSIPFKSVLALFIHYSGVTGDHASAALERALTESLALDEKTADEAILSAIKNVDARAKAVQKVANLAIPTTTRKGKTKFPPENKE